MRSVEGEEAQDGGLEVFEEAFGSVLRYETDEEGVPVERRDGDQAWRRWRGAEEEVALREDVEERSDVVSTTAAGVSGDSLGRWAQDGLANVLCEGEARGWAVVDVVVVRGGRHDASLFWEGALRGVSFLHTPRRPCFRALGIFLSSGDGIRQAW